MKKTIIFTAFLATATAANAITITLVDWTGAGSGRLTANEDITKETTFTTGSGFQSPTLGASGYNAVSPNFYSATSVPAADGYNIFNGGANDLLGRIQDFGANGTGVYDAMIVWNIGATVETFTMNGWGSFGTTPTGASFRFILQTSDNNWYATETAFTSGALTTATANAENWVAFTPHVAGVANVGAGPGVSGASLDFTGVQLAGFYHQVDAGDGGVFARDFTISGTVPEPSSTALLGLGLGAFILRRRK